MAKPVETGMPLLSVRDLAMGFASAKGVLPAVAGISFDVAAGETYALLGESGCGKSATALALMRLLPAAGRVLGGEVFLDGRELLGLPETEMRALRGGGMAMIFQEPATSLNPVMTVGRQIGEVLARRDDLSEEARRAKAEKLLAAVGIADAARRLDEYPFQMSGGMKQRVMIAMALAGDPALLVADEPTTALDVTIQAQILDLLQDLQLERDMGMLLITHDLGVVARIAHRVGVMYAGELVEEAPRDAFFAAPKHPYTQALFAARLQGRCLRLTACRPAAASQRAARMRGTAAARLRRSGRKLPAARGIACAATSSKRLRVRWWCRRSVPHPAATGARPRMTGCWRSPT